MRYDYFQYPNHVEPISTSPETVTESRWHQPWSDPTRRKGITAALRAASGPSYVAGAVTAEFVFEDKWHFAWSEPIVKLKSGLRTGDQQAIAFNEAPFPSFSWYASLSDPVRLKIGLRAGDQQALAFNEAPFPSFSWYANLADPVRLKVGLHARHQEFFKYQPAPIIDIGWFNWLTEPKRFLRGLPPQEQAFFTLQPNPIISIEWFASLSTPVRLKRGLGTPLQQSLTINPFPLPGAISFGWFVNLSEPKRFKSRLLEADQEFLTRGTFVPTSYTAILDVTEQRDLFLGILSQFNIPLRAYVDIIENDPRKRGYLGIIEPAAQSSIVASIAEPQTVPTTGSAVSTVAGARVAIIVS